IRKFVPNFNQLPEKNLHKNWFLELFSKVLNLKKTTYLFKLPMAVKPQAVCFTKKIKNEK
ncbi:hypothetical protein NL448_28565, partial [Klebsiella pneumoniae]|nr:hypothetical protein [Klebsiella pneumoniae]